MNITNIVQRIFNMTQSEVQLLLNLTRAAFHSTITYNFLQENLVTNKIWSQTELFPEL